MNPRTRLLLLQLAVVLGFCVFFFYFALGAFGLLGADEPRYAQIAREMLTRHDWIVPVLNGQPWLEKPVLAYWKMMASYSLFGVHDWAARVPAASHAMVMVFAIFFFMRRFRPGTELDAALITASSAAIIGFGRGASTDMLLAATFCMAMLCWWTWRESQNRLWLAGFYALLAMGALAKGPVAPALALLVVGVFALVLRERSVLLRSIWWPGLLLFFAIVLPWFVMVQARVPQFFRVFFLQHNLERFGTNLYQHSQPFWYYIPVFLLSTVPWVVFVVPAIVEAGKDTLRNWRGQELAPAAQDRLPIFLLVWTLVPVLFFSISRSKLPGYILPGIPAALVLTAEHIHRSEVLSRIKIALHSLLCGLLLVGALLAPWSIQKVHPPQGAQLIMAVAGGVIAAIVMFLVRRGGVRNLHFATLLPTVLAVAFLLRPASASIDLVLSARSVDLRMRQLGITSYPLAGFKIRRDLEYGLNFYRNQPVQVYETNSMPDEQHGIPAAEHIVITREGEQAELQSLLGARRAVSLGTFPSQHLEFYLVDGAK